jgi:septal ring factor EnvC (AmiA/AmiB activator)
MSNEIINNKINIQVPTGGCAGCGKFADETQELQKVFMARTSGGEWFCADCLKDIMEEAKSDRDTSYGEASELRGQVADLEDEVSDLEDDLRLAKGEVEDLREQLEAAEAALANR